MDKSTLSAKKVSIGVAAACGGYLFTRLLRNAYESWHLSSSSFRPKVVIIGAGLSGICMAIKLKELHCDDFIIYEQLSDLGGTWFANTYPGCCCDVPGHLYS